MPGNNFCLRSSSASSSQVSGGRALSTSNGHLKPSQWKYLQIKGPKYPVNSNSRDMSTHIVPLALPGKGQEREHASAGTAGYGIGKSPQTFIRAIWEKRRYVVALTCAHCTRTRLPYFPGCDVLCSSPTIESMC